MAEIQRYRQSQAVEAVEKVKRVGLVMEEAPLNDSIGSTQLPFVVLFVVSEGHTVVLMRESRGRG
jgi:hypothetical protein